MSNTDARTALDCATTNSLSYSVLLSAERNTMIAHVADSHVPSELNLACCCRVHFTGYDGNSGPKTSSEFGVKIDGSGSPVEIDLAQIWMQFCQFGVEITGTVEGVSITQANMVAVVVGVSTVTSNKPQLALTQSHIAAYTSGIVATGTNSLNIYGCLIYAFADRPAGQAFIGINVSNSTGNILNMNQFADTSTPSGLYTAISFTNTDFSSVVNNICLTPVTAFTNVVNPISRLNNFANNICEGTINDSG